MKKLIILCSVFAALTFTTTYAQEAQKKAVKSKMVKKAAVAKAVEASKAEGAGMVFEQETVDYGEIAFKSDGARQFVFTNNGSKPLLITNCAGSCGCTVPEWPREPIAPGAKAVIGVKYDTARPGPISKSITITSNAVGQETKVVYIKGNVGADPTPATPGTIEPVAQPTKI